MCNIAQFHDIKIQVKLESIFNKHRVWFPLDERSNKVIEPSRVCQEAGFALAFLAFAKQFERLSLAQPTTPVHPELLDDELLAVWWICKAEVTRATPSSLAN